MNFFFMVLSALLIIIPISYPDLYYLSWVALLPCLYSLQNKSPKKSFGLGWVMGIVIMVGSGYWLYFPLSGFSNLSNTIIIILIGLLFSGLGLIYGFWAWLYRYIQGSNTVHPFFLAISWVGVEYLRYIIIPDYPFAYLGFTQVNFKPILQVAALGGFFLISFFVILINGYIFKLIINSKKIKSLVTIIIIMIGIISYGSYMLKLYETRSYNKLQLGLIQTQIAQEDKWLPANISKNLNNVMEKALSLADTKLIITPETSLTFDLVRNQYYREKFFNKSEAINTFIQVGSQAIIDNNTEKYNSSFLISPDNEINNRYNKNKLVPFGEYLPIATLIRYLTGVNLHSLIPGENAVIFKTSSASWRTVICSEILYPFLVKKNITAADFIVNQSNEAWFGQTNLQQQMWAAAIMRAVENRKSVAKASNYAFNGLILPSGISELKTDITGEGTYKVLVRFNNEQTYYQQWGDYVGYGSALFLLIILIIKIILVYRGD